MPNVQQNISVLLCASLVLTSVGFDGCKKGKESGPDQAPATTYAAPTPDQLYQLVAPIALFPDKLIAQVLAGSTFPDQITEAWTWVQQNSGLKGDQLLQTVDQQSWDVSVKGLTQFPDVMQQMATNLSWTSALGDAYFNAPQDVMNAVQVMRQKAYQAGNLKSTPQQNVQVENQAPASEPAPASSGEEQQVTVVQPPPQTIIIEPAQPEVVYVPSYNPTAVYGAPVAAYPGYSTGDMVATGLISFGVGMMMGAAMSNNGCCGWGWNSWGCGWNNSSVHYNNNVYISNSNTFANRTNYNGGNRVNNINRNNVNRPAQYNGNRAAAANRGGDFGNSPRFDQSRNQAQFRDQGVGDRGGRNQGVGDQNRRNQGVGDQNRRNQGVGDQNRRNQGVGDQSRRDQGVGDRGKNQRNQAGRNDRQASRGYGDRQDRSAGNGMGNYGQGGNARANSARGQQSMNGGGNRGGANASATSRNAGGGNRSSGGGGGGNRGGGGGAKSGGGNRGGGRSR